MRFPFGMVGVGIARCSHKNRTEHISGCAVRRRQPCFCSRAGCRGLLIVKAEVVEVSCHQQYTDRDTDIHSYKQTCAHTVWTWETETPFLPSSPC
eukprot:6347824-Amphidinium_carterae.1